MTSSIPTRKDRSPYRRNYQTLRRSNNKKIPRRTRYRIRLICNQDRRWTATRIDLIDRPSSETGCCLQIPCAIGCYTNTFRRYTSGKNRNTYPRCEFRTRTIELSNAKKSVIAQPRFHQRKRYPSARSDPATKERRSDSLYCQCYYWQKKWQRNKDSSTESVSFMSWTDNEYWYPLLLYQSALSGKNEAADTAFRQ